MSIDSSIRDWRPNHHLTPLYDFPCKHLTSVRVIDKRLEGSNVEGSIEQEGAFAIEPYLINNQGLDS